MNSALYLTESSWASSTRVHFVLALSSRSRILEKLAHLDYILTISRCCYDRWQEIQTGHQPLTGASTPLAGWRIERLTAQKQ